MALGHRNQEQQPSFWIAVDDLPRSEGHVFYRKLNQLLREAGFDELVAHPFSLDFLRYRH